MKRHTMTQIATLAICFVLAAAAFPGAQAAGKKPISYDAYDGWRSIQGTQLSRDGAWLSHALVAQDGDGEIVVRNLKTGTEHRHPRGRDGVITADGKYVVFTIVPAKAEVEKAKKEKKKPEDQPKNSLGILNLATGETATVERVKGFKVPEEGSSHIAYLCEPALKKPEAKPADEKKEPEVKPEGETKPEAAKEEKKPEKKKDPGTDLVVRELATGAEARIAEVLEYAWNESGSWLAYTVSSKTPAGDGCFARKTADGTTLALLAGEGNYKGLVFDKKGEQVAFASDRDEYKEKISPYKLYHWSAENPGAAEIVSAGTPGIPAGASVSPNGRIEFSRDGARLFFGTAQTPKPEPEDAPEAIKVDIWHYRDPELQSMQKVRAEEAKKRSFRAVYHLKERSFIQLADENMPEIALQENALAGLGSSNVPYRMLVSWDGSYNDYYVVDLWKGTRKKVVEMARFGATMSPGTGYVLYFDPADNHWYTIHTASGEKANLTANLGVRFEDENWDTPDQPRAYGTGGWTADDKSVLLYDRYDIWEVRPDGSGGRMVTRGVGRKNGIVFRYQRLDPEERTVPSDKPILLDAVDDRTKASGFYRTTLGQDSDPAKVVMMDKAFGRLIKAKNAQTVVFTLSRFEEFPDLWVSDLGFSGMNKVSQANPQQAEYNWGRAELIDYRNADGKMLRAMLIKPEDFDPAKKYPMMVYIYEQLTQGLHRYVAPSPGTSINLTRYVSNGYIVLQPDIVYDIGYPGESALKCVIPAVQKVLDMGFVDPARVGIQGHSWGGYQISYLITRTNIFRAVEAGAPVVNMISAYGGIRWGTGMSRAFQYEKTQSRIGGSPWNRPLQFFENSPIFWIEKINTPYLVLHNDEDDAVPWYQGIEFITALRQLGKEAYMFNYNGERHGLRQRENQKHWTVHMDEFFDHHLKGAPKPEWMEKGIPFLDRGTRDLRQLFGKEILTQESEKK